MRNVQTYETHPHSDRSRRVHRARDKRGPCSLAAFVIVLIWAPPVALLSMWLTGSLLEAAARVHPFFPAACLGGITLGVVLVAAYRYAIRRTRCA